MVGLRGGESRLDQDYGLKAGVYIFLIWNGEVERCWCEDPISLSEK